MLNNMKSIIDLFFFQFLELHFSLSSSGTGSDLHNVNRTSIVGSYSIHDFKQNDSRFSHLK